MRELALDAQNMKTIMYLFIYLFVFGGFLFVSLSWVWGFAAAAALNKIYRCLTVGSSK